MVTQLNEPTNHNSLKVSKVLSNKSLGTSVINILMSPPFRIWMCLYSEVKTHQLWYVINQSQNSIHHYVQMHYKYTLCKNFGFSMNYLFIGQWKIS